MDDKLTNFFVEYNIEDTTAAADATFSTEDEQQYPTEISELKNPHTPLEYPFFTFEHNFDVLDGSKTEMGNDSYNEYPYVNNSSTINTIIYVESVLKVITVTSSSSAGHAESKYSKTLSLAAGAYHLVGCPTGGANDKYYLEAVVGGTSYKDYGSGITFTLSSTTTITVSIVIAQDSYVEDLEFKPIVSTAEPPYVDSNLIVPYFNKELSDMDGYYETNPKILITFSREHASFAFVVNFYDHHPLEMKLTFYNLDGDLIDRYTIPITSNKTMITKDVYGYAKIILEFTKTIPSHYVKLASFLFGAWITWDETNVKNANLVQQVDRLSKTTPVETLSFTVIDAGSELNLGNVDGMHKYFQTNQFLLPYEVITYPDGTQKKIALGRYYLKTFSENTNLGKMSAQSYLGVMSDVTFYGGEIYDGKRAGEVIDQIFATMNFTDYTIDEETYDTLLYGTITPKSCKKALQEVLFACNSIVNAHDVNNVIIKKSSPIRKPDIGRDKKFTTTTTKNKYVYGVEVKYTSYVLDEESKEIAKGHYTAGTHTIYFNEPHVTLSINTGTITAQSIYSVEFEISVDADVIVSGYSFTTTTNIARYTQSKLKAGEGETIVTYATNLCNDVTAKELAKKILSYLNFDLTIKIKWLPDDNEMGDLHLIENSVEEFNSYVGIFTKRSFDLTGGFVDTAELTGQVTKESEQYFNKYDEPYELMVSDNEGGGII